MCTVKSRKFSPYIFNICIFSKDIQIFHTVQEPKICINYPDPTLTQTDSKLRRNWPKLTMSKINTKMFRKKHPDLLYIWILPLSESLTIIYLYSQIFHHYPFYVLGLFLTWLFQSSDLKQLLIFSNIKPKMSGKKWNPVPYSYLYSYFYWNFIFF